MTQRKLTRIQSSVYRVISAHIERHGFAPTYREINEVLGFKSTSQTRGVVERIVERGWLVKEARAARGLALVKPPREARVATLEDQAQAQKDLGCLIRWDVNASGAVIGFTAWRQPTADTAHELVGEVGITG